MKNFDWGAFFGDILSVMLGIFITFGIQGMIDRRAERKDVKSALALVREELVVNKGSLEEVINLISSEKDAAVYIRNNAGQLSKCNQDTLNLKNAFLTSEYFFTVTDDALELLKTSSLFQKMNDNELALSIIKAYDYLDVNSQAFNKHEKYKTSVLEEANNSRAKKAALTNSGLDFFNIFYSSPEADYFLKSVIEMSDISFLLEGMEEVDATIAALDKRLN